MVMGEDGDSRVPLADLPVCVESLSQRQAGRSRNLTRRTVRLASSILEGLESWFAIFETKGISIRGSNIWINMIGRHSDS